MEQDFASSFRHLTYQLIPISTYHSPGSKGPREVEKEDFGKRKGDITAPLFIRLWLLSPPSTLFKAYGEDLRVFFKKTIDVLMIVC